MRSRIGLRWFTGLTVIAAALVVAGAALGVSGAVSTTDNPGHVDSYDTYTNQACLNGQGVNCNIYPDKRDVWFSGLPVSAALGAGTYFFAVLSPGGQPNPNDCAPVKANGDPANLSDFAPCETTSTGAGDTWTHRVFSTDGNGAITYPAAGYLGGHDFDSVNNLLQVFPYDNTPNNGGVYILAVCKVPDGAGTATGAGTPGVDPHICKYDAFKVQPATPCTTNCNVDLALDLTGSKDATPSWQRTFSWTISKAVDKTQVNQINGSPTATFNYTVTATPSISAANLYKVTGKITVNNPNVNADTAHPDDVTGVSVSDAISSTPAETNASCVVSDGSVSGNAPLTVDHTNATIPDGGSIIFPYTCTYSQQYANASQTNRATVTWPGQVLPDGNALVGNTINPTAPIDWTTLVAPTLVHNCVDITDAYAPSGTTGTPVTLASNVCANADGNLPSTDGALVTGATYRTSNPAVTGLLKPITVAPIYGPYTSLDLKYSRTVSAPSIPSCSSYDNTATYTATDLSTVTGDSSKVTVRVCNFRAPVTPGYWKNHLADSVSGTNHPWYSADCAKKVGTAMGSCSTQGPWAIQYLPPTAGKTMLLGTYAVTGIVDAANIFNLMNCSSTKDQDAVGCLAGHLLAAKLNVANGSPTCISGTITAADALLTSLGYNGTAYKAPSGGLSAANRTAAINLKNTLSAYNQGTGCSGP